MDNIDPFEMPRDENGKIISDFYETKKMLSADRRLLIGARDSDFDMMQAALADGADINTDDGEPLMGAVRRNDCAVAAWLLKVGADVHEGDDHALRDAAYRGQVNMVTLLVSHGADPFAMRGGALSITGGRAREHTVAITDFLTQSMANLRDAFVKDLAASAPGKFLRVPYQEMRETGFIRAAKMNVLDEALEAFQAAGERLSVADICESHDRSGRSLAAISADRGQLKKLFKPELWQGRADEMIEAYQRLSDPLRVRGGIPKETFSGVIAAVRQEDMRKKGGKFNLASKPPKPPKP